MADPFQFDVKEIAREARAKIGQDALMTIPTRLSTATQTFKRDMHQCECCHMIVEGNQFIAGSELCFDCALALGVVEGDPSPSMAGG